MWKRFVNHVKRFLSLRIKEIRRVAGYAEMTDSVSYIKGASLPQNTKQILPKIIMMSQEARILAGLVAYGKKVMGIFGNMPLRINIMLRAMLGSIDWSWRNKLEGTLNHKKSFTTRTETKKIIELRTSNYSQNLNTQSFTLEKIGTALIEGLYVSNATKTFLKRKTRSVSRKEIFAQGGVTS